MGVKVSTRRGSYERSSLICRKRIIAATDRGNDWISIAEAHGVKKSTVPNWVRGGRAEQKKRGRKWVHVKKYVVFPYDTDRLNDNLQLTLKILTDEL